VIKSHRHFWASINYIHHNPVHHGYVGHWQDWPWSSATRFLEHVGRERALHIWREFPILDTERNGTLIEIQAYRVQALACGRAEGDKLGVARAAT
jgi:putative transposase